MPWISGSLPGILLEPVSHNRSVRLYLALPCPESPTLLYVLGWNHFEHLRHRLFRADDAFDFQPRKRWPYLLEYSQ
jgi:hypothetical protein